MIHIRNERKMFSRISADNQIVSTEYKELNDGYINVNITAKACKWPLIICRQRVSGCISADAKSMLKRTEEKIPATEILSASLHITSPQFDGKFELSAGSDKRRTRHLLPMHRYEIGNSSRSNIVVAVIMAPLKFSFTKFKRIFAGMQLDFCIRLRRIKRIEFSADYMYFSGTTRSSPVWTRIFLIKESNTQLRNFIETASEEDLTAKVADGTLCVYRDRHNNIREAAIERIMSAVFTADEVVVVVNIANRARETPFVMYSHLIGSDIQRCNDGRARCSVKESYGSERLCAITYYCDGAFPFANFDITYTLMF